MYSSSSLEMKSCFGIDTVNIVLIPWSNQNHQQALHEAKIAMTTSIIAFLSAKLICHNFPVPSALLLFSGTDWNVLTISEKVMFTLEAKQHICSVHSYHTQPFFLKLLAEKQSDVTVLFYIANKLDVSIYELRDFNFNAWLNIYFDVN